MHVVVVATEAVPFAKTGGLADVIGALPLALDRLGLDVSVLLPCHRLSGKAGLPLSPTDWDFQISIGAKNVSATVVISHLPGSKVPVYLIEQPEYFDREELYHQGGVDYPDNAERFVFFCRAAVEGLRRFDPPPDVIHVNDWQTALIPVYLREQPPTELIDTATLLTIHNLGYQGDFPASTWELIGLDLSPARRLALEHHGRLNFLKAGLIDADMISTVSPTYAREIQSSEFGYGLEKVLRERSANLRGIVNGIDTEIWNPSREPMLAAPYDVTNFVSGKAACKAALQRRASLPERSDVPLLAAIGRLDPQKGWDLISEVADDLLEGDIQMVVLGEGLPRYHERLDRLADRHPGKLRVFLEFSKLLSHQIEAGADMFLMPSLYEPCGLNQLYSLAHGTVPIVRATGGLVDTVTEVTDATLAAGTANGFMFREPTAVALRGAIDQALEFWKDSAVWNQLIEAGMKFESSWARSASAYVTLYQETRRRASIRVLERSTTESQIKVGMSISPVQSGLSDLSRSRPS